MPPSWLAPMSHCCARSFRLAASAGCTSCWTPFSITNVLWSESLSLICNKTLPVVCTAAICAIAFIRCKLPAIVRVRCASRARVASPPYSNMLDLWIVFDAVRIYEAPSLESPWPGGYTLLAEAPAGTDHWPLPAPAPDSQAVYRLTRVLE